MIIVMRWVVATAAMLTVVAASLVFSAAAVAAAGEDLTWSVRPATSAGADGRIAVEHTLAPGDTLVEHAEVRIYSSTGARFDVYARDGFYNDNGRFDMTARSADPADAGSWISVDESVDVPDGGAAVIAYTIRVPEDAVPGTHLAGLAAAVTSSGGAEVAVESRVGFRISITVTGDLVNSVDVVATLDFGSMWNPFAPGRAVLVLTVTNTGNVTTSPVTDVTVRGPFGIVLGAAPQHAVGALAPGEERDVTETFESIWPVGLLIADIATRSQTDRLPESVTALSVTAAAVPWMQFVVLLLVVLCAVGVARHRRRARAAISARIERAREEGRQERTGVRADVLR